MGLGSHICGLLVEGNGPRARPDSITCFYDFTILIALHAAAAAAAVGRFGGTVQTIPLAK